MALLPKVKLKTVVSFPAAVFGGAGIAVRQVNGQFYFDLDYTDFAPPVGGIADPAHQNALLWNSVTNSYALAPVSLLGSGGAVPEAPNDGVQYGRQSLTWTPVVSGGSPSNANPAMDGVAAPGASALYSRGDHVHPTDTSRAAASALPVPASATPLIESGTGAVGVSAKYAREDHVHPASAGTGSGNVTGPSGAVSGNIATYNGATGLIIQDGGVSIANLAPVSALPVPAAATPIVESGSGAVGTSAKYAREDHVHPAAGGSGNVTGPAAAVSGNLATYNGTTGKIIQDGGTPISGLQPANADLAAIAALSGTGIARRTGPAAWSLGTAIANSELATMAAFAFKGNNTAGVAAPTDVTIAGLPTKAAAGTDYVMISDQAASGAWKKSLVSAFAGGVASINGQTGALALFFPPQGRLTVLSGTPVMTATVTGNNVTIYTPYVGNMVLVYDGTFMIPTPFVELSQVTTDATKSPAACVASSNYDLFAWNDVGTLRCTRGPAWTGISRGSGAGTSELVRVQGILLNANAITNGPAAQRGTYLGSVRTRAADATIDWIIGGAGTGGVAGSLGIWNAYNRVYFGCVSIDNGAPYTYAIGSNRQARASAGNQNSFLVGLAEDTVSASYAARCVTTSGLNAAGGTGIGLNSAAAYSFSSSIFMNGSASSIHVGTTNSGLWNAPIGWNTVYALENSDGSASNTFNGASNNALSVGVRC
jgi:hypothetical protein